MFKNSNRQVQRGVTEDHPANHNNTGWSIMIIGNCSSSFCNYMYSCMILIICVLFANEERRHPEISARPTVGHHVHNISQSKQTVRYHIGQTNISYEWLLIYAYLFQDQSVVSPKKTWGGATFLDHWRFHGQTERSWLATKDTGKHGSSDHFLYWLVV